MRRSFLLSAVVISLFAALTGCTVSPILDWVYVPDEGSVWGLTVSNTNDGGFIVGGGYDSQYSMYALKLTSSGLVDWDMEYSNLSAGGSHSELWRTEARGLLQTSDGGYIMVGSGKNDNDGMPENAYLLVKTDYSGQFVWSKTYAPVNPYIAGQLCINDAPGALDITDDGGYFVAGSSYVGGYELASVLKTDADGNVDFLKVINDNAKAYNQIITGGQQTADGGYILCGYSDNGSPHGYLALLIKLDADGNTEFSKTYQYVPGGYGAMANGVTETMDGNYVLGGDLINSITKSLGHGPWMAEFDADGDLLWEQAIPADANIVTPRTFIETPQGDLLAGGEDHAGAMALSKFTANGSLLWTYVPPEDVPHAIVNDITLTEDGGCVMVGSGISTGTVVAKVINVFTVEEDR